MSINPPGVAAKASRFAGLRALTSLWPYRGMPALLSYLIGAALPPKPGSWVVSSAKGLCPELELDLSSYWHRELYFFPRTYGRFYLNRQLSAYLPTVLREGSVFLDIGANVGIFTQAASRLVGATGKVISFEPEPTTFGALSRSAKRNGLSNVTCVRAAVSNHAGTAAFNRAGDGTASSLLQEVEGRGNRYVETMSVPVVTLDDYVKESALNPSEIALMKVDVEGEEPRTIGGMLETLRESRAAIWCEVRGPKGSTRAPNTCVQVADLLAPLGYLPHRWEGRPVPVRASAVIGREDILFLKG
jgi:FkbM family methyltransferase